jgi:hypothetical protein
MKPKRSFIEVFREANWHDRKNMLKGIWHRNEMRIHNRIRDAYAILRGACNSSTWDETTMSYNGGYSHWRCGKRRGHADTVERWDSVHRFHNYTWEGPGYPVEYAPLPIRNEDNTGWFDARSVVPFMKITKNRHCIDTRRRNRLRARHDYQMMMQRRVYRAADAAARLNGAIEASFRRHGIHEEEMPKVSAPVDREDTDQHPR